MKHVVQTVRVVKSFEITIASGVEEESREGNKPWYKRISFRYLVLLMQWLIAFFTRR